MTRPADAEPRPDPLADMSRSSLAVLGREYLLAGHLIDPASMPLAHGSRCGGTSRMVHPWRRCRQVVVPSRA